MPAINTDTPQEASWIIGALHETTEKVNRALEQYRFDDAASEIYQFFWGSFCDHYIEFAKDRLEFFEATDRTKSAVVLASLINVFETSLRLLSPFMPFLTEELWRAVYRNHLPAKSIALAKYPSADPAFIKALNDVRAESQDLKHVIDLIRIVRSHRKERNVPEKASVGITIWAPEPNVRRIIEETEKSIRRQAHVDEIEYSEFSLARHSTPAFDVAVVYERPIDIPAERDRLTKDIAKYEKGLAAAERQLGNENFLSKAPAQVVEGLKKQEAETRLLLEKAQAALDALPAE
jgi:valyl-tRNA synthetase